ncbi:MAG: hypothetical protein M3419_04030 [Actinomycetota bacterium]|nr:hypothetical protein [Actinomycetota bacterium]
MNGDTGTLDAAVRQLRQHTDERWVEIESDVLARLLTASRPSHPLKALSTTGAYAVSEQVLVSYLLTALDRAPDCEVSAIRVHADKGVCTAVTIIITARYGRSLLDVSDTIRIAADDIIAAVLGGVRPRVTVTDMHVHVDDITRGDPRRGKP